MSSGLAASSTETITDPGPSQQQQHLDQPPSSPLSQQTQQQQDSQSESSEHLQAHDLQTSAGSHDPASASASTSAPTLSQPAVDVHIDNESNKKEGEEPVNLEGVPPTTSLPTEIDPVVGLEHESQSVEDLQQQQQEQAQQLEAGGASGLTDDPQQQQ